MKFRIFGTLLLISLFVAQSVSLSPAANPAKAKSVKASDFYKDIELFTDALSIIQLDYVEEKNSKDLIYGALKGMLQSLDPHSQFMDPDTYNEMKIETEGEFGGLGIEITIQESLLTIITPIDDTPADRAGLKAGDRIVKIGGELTRDITLLEAVKKLRGKPGTEVTLTILRENEERLLEIIVVRDVIKIKSIKEARMVEKGIGYVRLSEFQENTPKDLEQALVSLEKEGMQGLILDLRNNPGGLLNTAVAVADGFVPKGELIVYTKGRKKDQDIEFRGRGKYSHAGYPLVVLINGGSASGSEILAGAIQDHKRGILLGTKSFGKGSVQTVIPLKDGSALRLTTSKYFTPKGRLIHGEGIVPDVAVEFEEKKPSPEPKKEKNLDVFEKIEKEEKKDKEKETAEKDKKDEKKKEEKPLDNQLLRAIDLLKGINVYRTMGG
ncbi:MAG: S41 family peptidase [Candidatus Omnitrophica bacterium]|nr:S41 family peptidase [Candidatus Omnitrophota bacterium]